MVMFHSYVSHYQAGWVVKSPRTCPCRQENRSSTSRSPRPTWRRNIKRLSQPCLLAVSGWCFFDMVNPITYHTKGLPKVGFRFPCQLRQPIYRRVSHSYQIQNGYHMISGSHPMAIRVVETQEFTDFSLLD